MSTPPSPSSVLPGLRRRDQVVRYGAMAGYGALALANAALAIKGFDLGQKADDTPFFMKAIMATASIHSAVIANGWRHTCNAFNKLAAGEKKIAGAMLLVHQNRISPTAMPTNAALPALLPAAAAFMGLAQASPVLGFIFGLQFVVASSIASSLAARTQVGQLAQATGHKAHFSRWAGSLSVIKLPANHSASPS